MNHYVSLGEFSLQRTLNLACAILESNGVATVVQHLSPSSSSSFFRLLVPEERFHASTQMLAGLALEQSWISSESAGDARAASTSIAA